jgi:hypothetical protein
MQRETAQINGQLRAESISGQLQAHDAGRDQAYRGPTHRRARVSKSHDPHRECADSADAGPNRIGSPHRNLALRQQQQDAARHHAARGKDDPQDARHGFGPAQLAGPRQPRHLDEQIAHEVVGGADRALRPHGEAGEAHLVVSIEDDRVRASAQDAFERVAVLRRVLDADNPRRRQELDQFLLREPLGASRKIVDDERQCRTSGDPVVMGSDLGGGKRIIERWIGAEGVIIPIWFDLLDARRALIPQRKLLHNETSRTYDDGPVV